MTPYDLMTFRSATLLASLGLLLSLQQGVMAWTTTTTTTVTSLSNHPPRIHPYHDHDDDSRSNLPYTRSSFSSSSSCLYQSATTSTSEDSNKQQLSIAQASQILADWDRLYNPDQSASSSSTTTTTTNSMEDLWEQLEPSVRLLNQHATHERTQDSTQGRVMLGICADDAAEGIQSLKSWVTNLQLPRGLLHGMDEDGVPVEMEGAVYIKYNSGGSYTFTDIRKSGLGFEALWAPGDALIEPYTDGSVRGVYFQVELSDNMFRQYLLPLDIFDMM